MQLNPTISTRAGMLRSSVVPTVYGDGAILLDLTTKYFYHLNETGWAIVQLMESGAAAPEAIVKRCAQWGATSNDAADIWRFLDDLHAFGLVEEAQPASLPDIDAPTRWISPCIERQAEPLHRLVTSAFDPSIPLAE